MTETCRAQPGSGVGRPTCTTTIPEVLVRALLAAAAAATLLLTGCASDGSDSAGSSEAASGAVAESAPADSAGGSTAGDSESLEQLRVAPGAAVIRTADLSVRVDDVRAAADEAVRLVTSAGGGREAERRSGTGREGSAVLTLRVPPKAFDSTLAALAALGDERDRQLGSEDVTDQVVDLEARLATQRASVERVRALLAEANTIGEVVQVEGEVTKRTADLEALEARLEALTAQVDLSTITLRLDSEGGPVVGSALGFGDGLRGGWAALTTTGRLLAVTAGALLPFLPLVLVGALIAWRARSRRATAVA